MTTPLLEAVDLSKIFPVKKGLIFKETIAEIKAVNHVSFTIGRNETVALVGESGSGKTTIARMVGRLLRPTSGKVLFDGNEIWKLKGEELKKTRRKIGFVFQDPFASFNPRMRVKDVVSEPLAIHHLMTKREREERVKDLLVRVGLSKDDATKFPHQFSGGQLQRIAIARALALEPSLIIADEPVSSLDVSAQAKIMNLMHQIQQDLGISYLMISHDLGVVRHVSHAVFVLYLGTIVEVAPADEFFRRSLHPYSQALLSAILVPDPEVLQKRPPQLLKGEIPSPLHLPHGCKFNTRCPFMQPICKEEDPPLAPTNSPEHTTACFYWEPIEKGEVIPRF